MHLRITAFISAGGAEWPKLRRGDQQLTSTATAAGEGTEQRPPVALN